MEKLTRRAVISAYFERITEGIYDKEEGITGFSWISACVRKGKINSVVYATLFMTAIIHAAS
jgi:hypothetical protein